MPAAPRQRAPQVEGAAADDARRTLVPALAAIVAIALLDALAPATHVYGILLVLPVLVMAAGDSPRFAHITHAAAVVAFVAASWLGLDSAAQVGPARILALVVLVAAPLLVIPLQRRGLDRTRALREAEDARESNRLLAMLVAHDLSAPLRAALQAFDYIERMPIDRSQAMLVQELRARLRRSLTTSDAILASARAARGGDARARGEWEVDGHAIRELLAEDLDVFKDEARARGKQIEARLNGEGAGTVRIDLLVLRQLMALLLEQAVGAAGRGAIRLSVACAPDGVTLTLEDPGPELAERARDNAASELGLDLCRSLLRRVKGEFQVLHDAPGGVAIRARVPARPAS